MSQFESRIPLSNEDGYLSDGSWCSDFDDSPESSDNWPLSEDYSQEIKDNQINENLEAKLVNATYVNTQPLHSVSEVSSQVGSATANSPPNKVLTKNLGAIPKTAFSYLNNELNQNIKNKFIIKGSPRHDKHLKEVQPGSIDKPSQSLNLHINPSNTQKSASHEKPITEGLQDIQNSNTTIPTQKTPSKLKPEAFSFLSRVIDNQSSKEYKKHFVPTAFVDEESLKRPHASPKIPESDKYECIEPEPTAPPFFGFQNNSDHSVDHTPSLTQVTNTIEFATTIQKQDKDIKPPLPTRPPPISKYPLLMFSQELPRASNILKSDQQKLILPPKPLQSSPIKIIPSTAKYSTATDRDISVDTDEVRVFTAPVKKCNPNRADIFSGTGFDVGIEDLHTIDEDKKPRKPTTPVGNSLPYIKNLDMSERPLPPVPISRCSKMTQNNNIQATSEINKIEEMKIKAETANQLSPVSSIEFSKGVLKHPSSSEETVPILENTNAEDETLQKRCVPELKPKPRQRIDIIGHQTNVSSETFHSQHKISAAITARLQKQSSMNDSYEKPKTESSPFDFTEQGGCTRSVVLNTEPKNASILSRQEKDPTSKGHSPVRTFSDIDELQQSIARPCLPQKLRTTQRSVSCTSLVQTFKDMSFSIWNSNDKEKRRSEGRNSFESPTRILTKENTIFEKPREISKVSGNEKETILKVVYREEKVDVNPTTEMPIMSRFAWYHHISAREAQRRLLALGQDGTFLIRPSSTPTADIQYTTCVVYYGRVLNLHIRQKPNGQYALGKEKTVEKTFSSLSDLIKYHQDIPIEICPASRASNQELIYVYLRVTPPK